MTVVLDYSNCSPRTLRGQPDWIDDQGQFPDYWKKKLDEVMANYGSFVQYYEICNEPCMYFTDAPLAATVAVARYLQTIKPPHLKIAAPGFAYAGGQGDPKDWDIHSEYRRVIEAACDIANGHGYGSGFMANRGSFNATNCDYGDNGIITNGFPREFVNTEMGVRLQSDVDERLFRLGQAHASLLDRIKRILRPQ